MLKTTLAERILKSAAEVNVIVSACVKQTLWCGLEVACSNLIVRTEASWCGLEVVSKRIFSRS